MAQMRNAYVDLVGKPEGTIYHLEYVGLDGRIILKWILKE
jgi:hypothetical protein